MNGFTQPTDSFYDIRPEKPCFLLDMPTGTRDLWLGYRTYSASRCAAGTFGACTEIQPHHSQD
jgi:hypothetical protein